MSEPKIIKIPPVTCPKCKGTNISKTNKNVTECNDCRTVFNTKTGKETKVDRNWHTKKGFIPKEQDDYGPQY